MNEIYIPPTLRFDAHAVKACGRRLSVADVFLELTPTAAIETGLPAEAPHLLFGLSVDELSKLHDRTRAGAVELLADGRRRRIRADQLTLFRCIVSLPISEGICTNGATLCQEIIRTSISWLRRRFGDQLKTIVSLKTESELKLVALAIPAGNMSARQLHPGEAAKLTKQRQSAASGVPKGLANRLGNDAFRNAVRLEQRAFRREMTDALDSCFSSGSTAHDFGFSKDGLIQPLDGPDALMKSLLAFRDDLNRRAARLEAAEKLAAWREE